MEMEMEKMLYLLIGFMFLIEKRFLKFLIKTNKLDLKLVFIPFLPRPSLPHLRR